MATQPHRSKRLQEFLDGMHDLFQFMDREKIDINTRGSTGDTPLKVAVVRDDAIMVAELLAAGADPNIQGEDDYTPLHHAVVAGDVEIVRLLVAGGALSTLRNFEGRTALEVARMMRHTEVQRLLEGNHPV